MTSKEYFGDLNLVYVPDAGDMHSFFYTYDTAYDRALSQDSCLFSSG